MRSKIYLSLLTMGLALFAACGGGVQQPDASEFEAFYEQFHSDPAYQMAHINFPLEGLPSDADAETIDSGNFHWDAEDWVTQRPFNFANSEFSRELLSFGDDLVIEKIIHRSGEYGTIRRFAKMGSEWYLIYYAGMNRIE
ncbi:MAG: hypothetical protein IPJ74_14430 [Saprospiraceae bacterium]|nr:hypothetical protein [Saprospiraceae bacterium]